jgi:hypothetical protein
MMHLLSTHSVCRFEADRRCGVQLARQPGDLGVLREVILGFSQEARTRGFASLSFLRFAFVAKFWWWRRRRESMEEIT